MNNLRRKRQSKLLRHRIASRLGDVLNYLGETDLSHFSCYQDAMLNNSHYYCDEW